MRSSNSVGKSLGAAATTWCCEELKIELLDTSGRRWDRVGVFEERKSRSRRLVAPLVGVSVGVDVEFRMSFCGV